MANLTSTLYKMARLSATARAVRRGRAPQRAWNIAVGRYLIRPLARRLYK